MNYVLAMYIVRWLQLVYKSRCRLARWVFDLTVLEWYSDVFVVIPCTFLWTVCIVSVCV